MQSGLTSLVSPQRQSVPFPPRHVPTPPPRRQVLSLIRQPPVKLEPVNEQKATSIEKPVDGTLTILHPSYEKPKTNDICVCMALFNTRLHIRPHQNYLMIRDQLKQANIPVFTIELYTNTHGPLIKDAIHVKANTCLFRKENLFRILETKIPKQYTKLVFMDTDVIFTNLNWINDMSALMDTHDIVHGYTHAKWLDISYTKVIREARSFVHSSKDIQQTHGGFVWGMTRKFYTDVGFYDNAIIGGGDTVFSNVLAKTAVPKFMDVGFFKQDIELYSRVLHGLYPYLKITCLPNTIYHLYHGSRENRKYVERWSLVKTLIPPRWELGFHRDRSGVIETKLSDLDKAIYQYFCDRREDDPL
jgi:hypothetical protein